MGFFARKLTAEGTQTLLWESYVTAPVNVSLSSLVSAASSYRALTDCRALVFSEGTKTVYE